MKDTLNENRNLMVLLGILVIVIFMGLYYYLVWPKIEAQKTLENSIDTLKNESKRLQNEVMTLTIDEEPIGNEYELRKKMPEKRGLNELLRSLQEVELVSKAKIQSIVFNHYDGLVSESSLGLQEEEDLGENTEEEEEEENEQAVEKPETKIDISALPNELKLLSFGLQVEVQDHDHLLLFMEEIEKIERLKRIESIQFSQVGEVELSVESPDESIVVTIQVTTFYSEEEAK